MRIVRNERGAALLYVMMVFAVLVIMTPVILSMTSTSSTNVNRTVLQKKTDQLAGSALESLMAYLKYKPDPNTSYETYFEQYPGWGQYTIAYPDGAAAEYKFGPIIDSSVGPIYSGINVVAGKNYDVQLDVTVTSGPISYSRQLKYNLTVPGGSGSGSSASGTGDGITVSPSTNPLVNPAVAPSVVVNGVTVPGMIETTNYPGGVAQYQADFYSMVPTAWNAIYTSSASFISGVANFVATHDPVAPYNTLTIECKCAGGVSLNTNLNLGSKNVAIYITGGDTNNLTSDLTIGSGGGGSLKMNGILLDNGNMTVKNNGSLTANNVFVSGTASYTQNGAQANVVISGTFGAGSTSNTSSGYPNITPANNTFYYPNGDTGTSPWDPKINP